MHISATVNQSNRLARRWVVDPALTFVLQIFTHFIFQLGRENTSTHAGTIRFKQSVDFAYLRRADTQTAACSGCYGVGRCYIRIGAEIHIQQSALCSFGQDGFTFR